MVKGLLILNFNVCMYGRTYVGMYACICVRSHMHIFTSHVDDNTNNFGIFLVILCWIELDVHMVMMLYGVRLAYL